MDNTFNRNSIASIAEVIVSPVDKKTLPGEDPVFLCNYTDVYYNSYITGDMSFMEATARPSEIEKFSLRPDDVIITKDSETPDDIGVPAYVRSTKKNLLCGYHLTILRSKGCVDGRFLSFALMTPRISYDFYRFANGITRFGLTSEAYTKIKIPLPPLPEQRAIADTLQTWDTAIEKTEALIAAKEKQFDWICQRCLTPNSPVTSLWERRRIGDFVKPRKEKSVPSEAKPLYSLTIEDGVTSKSDRYNREFLVKDKGNKAYKVVHPKDIVFNPANLRWGAIARSEVSHRVVISPIYEVFEVLENKIDKDYLTYALTCKRQIRIFSTMTEGTLIERMAVKADTFQLCEIIVPPTKEQQKRIAETLNTARQEIDTLKTLADQYRTQKRGLMQKLLTGKWRVKV